MPFASAGVSASQTISPMSEKHTLDVPNYDVLIVGGGASGLMCASQAASRGLSVLVLEKGPKVGLKILVSGGGRCNFTNLYADPQQQFLSDNPHFCISAMRRYVPRDFIEMVEAHGIAYHEKKLGQLFCDHSAKEITAMLLAECEQAGVTVVLNAEVTSIHRIGDTFQARTAGQDFAGTKLVLASGGLSLPRIATDLAFRVARSLELKLIEPRAALVPLTWNNADKQRFAELSGISLDVEIAAGGTAFRENLLFTHRGLSGPAVLQASSYWREGETLQIDLLPGTDAAAWLVEAREERPQSLIANVLKSKLPNRLVEHLAGFWFKAQKIGSAMPDELRALGEHLNRWAFKPGGSEGYRTAEVTLGGIDTNEVSSKTFELKRVPGMYAVGEALDVTGWLGGYNFQWAWSSGWCCGQHL